MTDAHVLATKKKEKKETGLPSILAQITSRELSQSESELKIYLQNKLKVVYTLL